MISLRLSGKATTALVASVGVGFVVFGYLLRRWLSSTSRAVGGASARREIVAGETDASDVGVKPDRLDATRSVSRMRGTPSMSERGSTRQSMRQRNMFSTSLPPVDADIIFGTESCQDLIRTMERALTALEMVKNRSDKDKNRADALGSIIDRLRVLETDLCRLAAEAGYEDLREDGTSSGFAGYSSARARTLSVLSDDSFMSALEEFAVTLDDESRDLLNLPKDQLVFLQDGVAAACNGEVQFRKMRSDFCQCENEVDFSAKLWCLRQAFEEVLRDEHRRLWLAKCGRSLLGDILKNAKQDPAPFYKAFDEMLEFFNDENNVDIMEEELAGRGVVHFGFYDIILDFIVLDAFDDLRNPPSAIYSLMKNNFLSQSMRLSTISTIIWSMLKAKRQRLKYKTGFLSTYYNISEAISPAITLGFLGTDSKIGELCHYFKEQISQFVLDVFSERRVRYTSLSELADDVWVVMQNRTEAVQTRLSTELLPA